MQQGHSSHTNFTAIFRDISEKMPYFIEIIQKADFNSRQRCLLLNNLTPTTRELLYYALDGMGVKYRSLDDLKTNEPIIYISDLNSRAFIEEIMRQKLYTALEFPSDVMPASDNKNSTPPLRT